MTDQLTELRASLDRLDDEMIVLLEQRFQISGKVAAAKNGSVTFRPGREAAIVRRLCDAAPQLDRAMLLGIWRHIFTASVAQQEGSLRIAAHENAEATAQWHFANGNRKKNIFFAQDYQQMHLAWIPRGGLLVC